MRNRRFLATAVLSTLLITGSVTTAAAAASPPDGDIEFSPTTTAVLRNPERGFFLEAEPFERQTEETLAAVKERGWTLIHGIADLSSFTDGAISEEWLNDLRSAFTAVRQSGIKVILRFTYSPKIAKTVNAACPDPVTDPQPGSDIPPDASLEVVTAQLEQLKPILTENADVIAALDAGFIGTWGEWHCSTNHLATTEGKASVLSAVLAAFPQNRQVGLRYPADIIDLVTDPAAADSRIGNHQDCYAASEPDDAGTWVPPYAPEPGKDYSVEAEKAVISALGQRHIVGGEACKASPRTTCDIANQELPYMHFSYMSGEFSRDAIEAYGPRCWEAIGEQLGYRFQLNSASVPRDPHPGDVLPVSFTLTNIGFASLFNPRPVFVTLEGEGVDHVQQVEVDPRNWAAGAQTTISAELHLPADLPRGQYRVSVWMPDEAENLRADHAYSIQFANDDVWDEAKGRNVLATIEIGTTLPATGGGTGATIGLTISALVLLIAGLNLVTARRRTPATLNH